MKYAKYRISKTAAGYDLSKLDDGVWKVGAFSGTIEEAEEMIKILVKLSAKLSSQNIYYDDKGNRL